MFVYKIFLAEEWAQLERDWETEGAPIDIADGYVHLSTAAQAPETAAKYFADVAGLRLLAVDPSRLGEDLKWEVSRGGDKFPHLYRKLRLTDVIWSNPLPIVDGVHQFPEDMP